MKLPTSFRLPGDILNKLKSRAEQSNQSASEIVCAALLKSFESEGFEINNVYELLKEPVTSYINIYKKLKTNKTPTSYPPLGSSEIKFMIYQISSAYRFHYASCVSPIYLNILLDISYELICYSKNNNIQFDEYYVYNCLDIKNDSINNLDQLKANFLKESSSGYAEMLLRPLESDAFNLNNYSLSVLGEIFNKERLTELLPIVLMGIKKEIDYETRNEIQSQIQGIAKSVNFNIGTFANKEFSIQCHGNDAFYKNIPGIFFIIEANDITIPMQFNHFLSLLRLCKIYNNPKSISSSIESIDVSLMSGNTWNILNVDGVRIYFKEDEYKKIINAIIQSEHSNLIKDQIHYFKCIYGDI